MEYEREEGEIVDLNDDDIYENIISSDEIDEDDLRQRIEELEAKNSELEKIASISKTYDYGLGCGSSNFIDLVADDGVDDDESYYRQPSKYDYSSYQSSSRKRSRSKRRKACRHECKKSKRYKPYKSEKRKKTQPNRTNMSRVCSDSSSDDEFRLDRNKLQAALKRNTTSIHSSTTLKRKLIGVSKRVEDFMKAKTDIGDEDISTSIEIMHLLNKINVEENAPKNVSKEEETESGLNEQELRIIALKSAILKKAEARKKRKIIETQPYSPTDDVDVENLIGSKASNVNSKPRDELDNMEISPAVSPTHQDGCLQPIDMELESDEEIQKDEMPSNTVTDDQLDTITVYDDMSLCNGNVPESIDRNKLTFDPSPQRTQQPEEEDEEALRASLLANMRAAKKKSSTNDLLATQKPVDADPVPAGNLISDAAKEMERLRKQVFSSMGKRKVPHQHRQLLPNPFAQKFSVQVPRPIEMTMPQITSNLKEALKRIKERDKQNVDTEPEITQYSVKKSCAPSTKINDVLKNVTCNNASVDTKVKDGANAPLAKTNKIETALSEKSDAVIRSVKAVAQKKVITEPQKENQQLRKVGLSSKRTSEEKPPIPKKAKPNNVKPSRVITTPVEKPVAKMIIQLNNSDTESDDLGLGEGNMESSLNSKSYSGVASPVSFNIFSPASPAVADNKPTDVTASNNDSFQRKLDEYLKSARTMVEQKKQETKLPIKKSSSLVSHLPPSSQLEYRNLINRMALLEKQKLLKLSKSKTVATKPKSSNISVTIANDLCNSQQPKPVEKIAQGVNGSVVGSSKNKENEVSTEVQTVDPETRVVSKIVTSAGMVATENGSRSNEPKKRSEVCATQKKTSPSKPKEPEELANFMQKTAALSEHDKKEMLQKFEAEYLSHSELILMDLNNMSELMNEARQKKEKQFQMESEIEALEARVVDLKKQLVTQKVSVSTLYRVILTSHKNKMKKRNEWWQLHKKCYLFGKKIVGADYKIPGDPKADIVQKRKSLSLETKLLGGMKKSVPSTTTTSTSTDEKCVQEESIDVHTLNATPDDAATITVLQSIDLSPDNAPQSAINGTTNNIPLPYSMMKYNSPLDHMKNIGVTNPDSILCPFQLLGQCEDRECVYQHLP